MSSQPKGYLALVLHAHLPYVRHPEHEDFLEEDWFYEAITETYLPLIDVMEGWRRDGVPWRLTMSLTPTLCSMFNDELLRERYVEHLQRLLALMESELARTANQPEFHTIAQMYKRRFEACLDSFENRHGRDLIGAFRDLQDNGGLEIITCGATHGFLPLMESRPEAVNAQISVAADQYRQDFGRDPAGIWNAECGYFPGLEETLKRHGLKYFFTDTHAILFGTHKPKYGVFAPVRTPSGVAAFGRDQDSSKSVWSTQHGYPGDPRYREFYRDIGYDLDEEFIKPWIAAAGVRHATGIKYHRITGKGPLDEKAPYEEHEAEAAADQHAGHFVFSRQQQILHLASLMDVPPLVTSPYDAELFGHWWYEGPIFLDRLVRRLAVEQTDIELITPSVYLERHPDIQQSTPALSSWGQGGFAEVWLEGSNDWVYRHLDKAAERMTELASDFENPEHLTQRALNQAARELLLAQSSDWAFIMKTGTTVDYARKRTQAHLNHFLEVASQIESGVIDEEYVAELELHHNIFPDIDYRIYAG